MKHCKVWLTPISNSSGGAVMEICLDHPYCYNKSTADDNTNNESAATTNIKFQRDPKESVDKFLKRLQTTVDKKIAKKSKKNKPGASWQASLLLKGASSDHDDNIAVPPSLKIVDALQSGVILTLEYPVENCQDGIKDTMKVLYTIQRDTPRITEASITELPLIDFPVCCNIKSEYANRLQVDWFFGKEGHLFESQTIELGVTSGKSDTTSNVCLTLPSQFRDTSLLGQALSVKCIPGTTDSFLPQETSFVQSDYPIHQLHELGLLAKNFNRAKGMGSLAAPPGSCTIRVMTYNVMWMKTSFDKSEGHKQTPDVPRDCTIWRVADLPFPLESRCYRQHILAQEILKYKPSIICLQEVTTEFMESYLGPVLSEFGKYHFLHDGNSGSELAVCYDAQRFQVHQHDTFQISDLLDDSVNKEILDACCQRSNHSSAAEAFLRNQPHLVQFALLTDLTTGKSITVINCHLVQNPIAEQMRAIQTALIVRAAQTWDGNHAVDGRFLVGDFNIIEDVHGGPQSVREATMTLLSTGFLSSSHYGFVHGRHCFGVNNNKPRIAGMPPADQRCLHIMPSKRQCPGRRWEHSLVDYCWDDTCVVCKRGRTQWKVPLCEDCRENANNKLPLQEQQQEHLLLHPEDLPDRELVFRCDLDMGGLKFVDAYELATETAPAPIYTFRNGRPILCGRDHIFLQSNRSSGFKVVQVAKPVAGQDCVFIPNLSWPSDHYSLVADFEWDD